MLLKSIGSQFKKAYLCDTEFSTEGGVIRPRCFVLHDLNSGQDIFIDENQLKKLDSPPFEIGKDAVFIAYFSPAELSCFLALDWEFPTYIFDLFIEFRNYGNGFIEKGGYGLLAALAHFGLQYGDGTECETYKDEMRQLALVGRDLSAGEMENLLKYCQKDTIAMKPLLEALPIPEGLPTNVYIHQALFRGEFMKTIARVEAAGIPVDDTVYKQFKEKKEKIKEKLIEESDFSWLYEGMTFKIDRFKKFLNDRGIIWPITPSGSPSTKGDVFEKMARLIPGLEPLKKLRDNIDTVKTIDLQIRDGRAYYNCSPFGTKTGRNTPSSKTFPLSVSKWARNFIKPGKGKALVIRDYAQQEFYIGALLSDDENMSAAYENGDPYMQFAILSKAAPIGATKATHAEVRKEFKQCILAIQYGGGVRLIAENANVIYPRSQQLLRYHKQTFQKFWKWQKRVVSTACIKGFIRTSLGWFQKIARKRVKTGEKTPSTRPIANFPCQATGAEILRRACYEVEKFNLKIIATVHDSIIVECDIGQAPLVSEQLRIAMEKGSEFLLGGKKLRTDETIVRYPGRYREDIETWGKLKKYWDQ
ncbi:DNA polymerase [Candidatus Riflebacteria bacterium]